MLTPTCASCCWLDKLPGRPGHPYPHHPSLRLCQRFLFDVVFALSGLVVETGHSSKLVRVYLMLLWMRTGQWFFPKTFCDICRLRVGNDIAVVIGQGFRLLLTMVVNLEILLRSGFTYKGPCSKVSTWEVECGDLMIVSLGVHGVTSLWD